VAADPVFPGEEWEYVGRRDLEAYGWSRSGKVVSEEKPERDFRGNEWFTDGHRLVLWISGPPVAMRETTGVEWDRIMEWRGER
jgi:hypothetical protein